MLRNREVLAFSAVAAVLLTAAFALCLTVSPWAGGICLMGGIGVYAACMVFTLHRYRCIKKLCDYLQALSRGAVALDIRDNAEGELSILKNEIYKAATALTEQAGALRKDKLELAGALSDISHQLKTPLTSMRLMTDLLENEDLPPERRAEFLDAVRECLGRMEWLVLVLLKLARLDADAVELKQERVSLSALAEKALAPMMIPMEVKGQACAVEGGGETVLCDPVWTAEALGNVIKNAVENTPEGGVITLSCGENPMYGYITVRDNGPGIPECDLPHLFQRFYRGQNASRDSAGIGLAMSLAVMRKQNGDIEVENDGGGVFTLKLYK